MKKIIISLSVVAAVAAAVVVGTTAFFSDTETSTGNTFTAGSIDLKIDNECSWSGGETCPWNNVENPDDPTKTMLANWTLNNLEDGVHKFFYFTDLKPGDWGEDTISMHVYDNDAWGRIYLDGVTDLDNDCTEPEDADETGTGCTSDGELDNYMQAMIWLDQGMIDGFQCSEKVAPNNIPRCLADSEEGDNIWQYENEPVIVYDDITAGWSYDLAEVLERAGTGPGLTPDGHMVGSITYYIGVGWCFGDWDGSCDGSDVDNTPQSDSLSGNINFQVEQYRNNEIPSWND